MTIKPHTNEERSGYKVFSKEELKEFVEVQTWLKTVSPHSSNIYLNALKDFCSWCGKSPKELILERDREKDNPDPNKRTGIKNLILDFRVHLEKQGYAPKTINSRDGAIRGFFSAVLGTSGMINIGNYANKEVKIRHDLIPTLEELRRMLDVSDIYTKFSIVFLAQTGMRPEDALKLNIGHIHRELNLGNVPLAICFLPEKDRNSGIGERITFIGSDGVEILKEYLECRKMKGEKITMDSPLFVGRTRKYNGKKIIGLSKHKLNHRVKEAAKKAGIGNGNGKYGRMRTYCLRKFFITQMTNHGVEDKMVNFFTCHKIPEVDLVYWSRRVEDREREKFLNPISGKQGRPSPEEVDLRIEEKLKEFLVSKEFGEACQNILKNVFLEGGREYESRIVDDEEEVVRMADRGYDCQMMGVNKWLMKRKILG
jgi:integrase/recombinase XerD